MPQNPVYLAIDLGATSGRIMAASLEEGSLELKEVHRFVTSYARLPSGYHWDVLDIYNEILEGLGLAHQRYGERIAGLGVDTWGVDYALIDAKGRLLGNPYQYRDARTDDVEDGLYERITRETIYEETGIQFMFFNTLFQLEAEMRDNPDRVKVADSLLFLPDLFSFWLCGIQVQERSIVSTSQMWNPVSEAWSPAIRDALGLPHDLFVPVTEPGTLLGPLTELVQSQTGLGAVPVICVAGHDTGSAVAGTPLTQDAPVFLSSGTWSIMGMESPRPIISEETFQAGFSNEAGVEKRTRFLKNICGMWILEQLRGQWASEGSEYSYENLLDMALEAKPFLAVIDPDDDRFSKPGDMVARIREFCYETSQASPTTKGEITRVVFESLACKYRIIFEKLENLAGTAFSSLRIVGGGCQNAFLNQCTANALAKPVIAGPIEATSIGNILMQLKATGVISSLSEGRALVETSFPARRFEPEDPKDWEAPIDRLKAVLPG
jgi:rhamnulokinase